MTGIQLRFEKNGDGELTWFDIFPRGGGRVADARLNWRRQRSNGIIDDDDDDDAGD